MSAPERATYLDASAFVKLIVIETETPALVEHLRARTRARQVSSALLRVEAVRAVRHEAPDRLTATYRALDEVDLLPLGNDLLRAAADLPDTSLKSLDAVHVAAAQAFGDSLGELITYDRRMALAARSLGLPVAAPA